MSENCYQHDKYMYYVSLHPFFLHQALISNFKRRAYLHKIACGDVIKS